MKDEIEYPLWETQGGTTPEQNEAHFDRLAPKTPLEVARVEQPHSDNNITGTTS